MTPPAAPVPKYGEASLADLMPSLLHALDVAGAPNPLDLEPLDRVCLLVIDGLGWELVREHPKEAPFLAGLAHDPTRGRPLTAGFPATTAVSLASIGTGRPPGEHGLVGYTLAVPGHDRAMNTLHWALYGNGPHVDLIGEIVPEATQPETTTFERAAADGVEMSLVGPRHLATTGLTRATLRGGDYLDSYSMGDLAAEARRALVAGRRTLVYAYHSELDATGHMRGTRSLAWRLQLAQVDRLASAIAEGLPKGGALIVTGDHGMVDLTAAERIDIDKEPDLRRGVRLMGGEARARHLYTEAGAAADVAAAWQAVLGDRMWVVSRDEAIENGWFGPSVLDRHRPRVGDVVAAAYGPVGVVQRSVDSGQAGFTGHHGSLTSAEQLVPLLEVRG